MENSLVERFRRNPNLKAELEQLSSEQLQFMAYDWKSWARPSQIVPSGEWANWLVMAGRGFGKTRTGAETVRQWIKQGFKRVNIIMRTKGDIEKILIQSAGGILNVCPPNERPIWIGNKNLFKWPNGATSFVFTAEEPDALRGPEHEKLWCDELAAWRYDQEAWDMANFGLRIGTSPQIVITTTPRPTALVRSIIAEKGTILTRGTTYDNRTNLSTRFYSTIISRYEGTRLGRQELEAEILDDNPSALWKRSNIDANRVKSAPPLTRIVIPVDPAVTSNEDSDESGIIPVGRDSRWPPHFYVLDDRSGIYTPDEMGKVACNAYADWQADRIIGEANNGGDMVEAVIRHQNANISYSKVTASRGKTTRAEPIAALYEQGRVHHVGNFAILEDQMCDWNPTIDSQDSPDRMDSLVWGITELASGSDNYLDYMKREVRSMASEGIIEANDVVNPAILHDGSNRNVCACGSFAFIETNGIDTCYKCGKIRVTTLL